jgi:hypothetical protein
MWRKREIDNQIKYNEIKTECNAMLMGLLGRQELVDKWWDGPNHYFGLRHPIDVFNSGEAGRQSVYNYLGEHCFGGGGN